MKSYDEKHIKNIVLIGGAKSGKTTLAETMAFEAGTINKRGTIENKNTLSDYHEIEHERGNSIYATPVHIEWKDYKINVLDTPGFDDFIGEVFSSIRVCDTAVLVLNAQNGIEVGTELIWDAVDKYQKPTIIAVNQIDTENANFDQCVDEAKATFGTAVTVMQYPYNPGPGFNAVIDLLKMIMYKFSENGGKPEKLAIPDDQKEKADELHNILVEKAAENDDSLMELYFDKGTLNEDEMRQGIKIGMMKHELFPVFCMSALKNMGSGRMMSFIDNVAPSAAELDGEMQTNGERLKCDPNEKTSLFIFKTLVEPHVGRVSFFKVTSGTVKVGMDLDNTTNDGHERISQLFIMDGKNRNTVDSLTAGDIGATVKLKDTKTNQTLAEKGSGIIIEPVEYPASRTRAAIVTKKAEDEEKLSEVIHDLQIEDPTLHIAYAKELKQLIIEGQGELHLAVTKWRLKKIFGIDIDYASPRIPYRETIQKPSLASYRHKKQSGGSGQFGEVYLKIEPYFEGMPDETDYNVRKVETVDLPWGGKLVFNNCITGGVIDTRYIPAIMKGIVEKMSEGPLTGSCVRDVRVSVYDGKMHPVDSNDISFKIAGMKAFSEAFHNANPQLLEPVYEIEVEMPEDLMGDVMSELQARRSIILGMDSSRGGHQVIKAKTPLAELEKSAANLRSITHGRAKLKSQFSEYLPVPNELQQQLTKEHSTADSE